jgi:hypothetical protein
MNTLFHATAFQAIAIQSIQDITYDCNVDPEDFV